MNNTILGGALTDDSAAPRANDRYGREQMSLTMITTETEEEHNSVKCIYHSTYGLESVFLMDEIDEAEREPLSTRSTDAPPLVAQNGTTKEPVVKQKRGRFLVWPVDPDQPMDFTTSSSLCW